MSLLTPWTGLSLFVAGHAETQAPVLNLHLPDAPLLTMESAGFHQCVAQLTSYMQKITPSQRVSLIEGLKHHTERQQATCATAPIGQRTTEAEVAPRLTPVDSSERRDGAPNFFLFPSLSPPQPLCSTPCHEHTSPPPSPWLSPCFSTYATSPSFPSFGPHFSSPHSLSPLSSNTSFFTFSPVAHHAGTPAFRYPPHPAPGEGSPPNSSLMWRPWCWWRGPETDELRAAVPPSGRQLQLIGCGGNGNSML